MALAIRDATNMLSAPIALTPNIMTILRKSGSPVTPASLRAITKGEAAIPDPPNSLSSSADTNKPINITLTR